MCGIFGLIAKPNEKLRREDFEKLLRNLFVLSEARGKESSGISIKTNHSLKNEIKVLKKSISARALMNTKEFYGLLNEIKNQIFVQNRLSKFINVIGHARLVTNGTQENNNNNQPVIKDELVCVHNGIITNVEDLWERYKDLISKRIYEVDTELILSLFRYFIEKEEDYALALKNVFKEIEGTISTAIQMLDSAVNIISTNNGSLYYCLNEQKDAIVFASERYILMRALELSGMNSFFNLDNISWLKPWEVILFNEREGLWGIENLKEYSSKKYEWRKSVDDGRIQNLSEDKPIDFEEVKKYYYQLKHSPLRNLLEYNVEAIKRLRRCKRCVLPETFPFIEFDEEGVCNYCKCYRVRNFGSKKEEFLRILEKFRSKDGKPDCLVPFSGGRDSSYGLHLIVNELGMHPITYTYDWGMVTDLARRNIARLCGKLGIENILVSADIHKKRRNIKLNVEAWLKNPQLGLVPLFMAGDKQFFYYVNQVKKQTGIPLDIWCTNYLENTDFKVGFCNVRPTFDKHRPDYLPLSSKIKMGLYYIKHFLINPAYINSSIWDTIFSFYAYYAEPRINFYQLYDWVKWDEEVINTTLIKEYNWELSPDTTSTWRIGDGTSAFYNYIYYTVAGFSEIETFRSNQIREGLISRDEAMKKIFEENRPRFESLKWYLDVIQVDFERAIKIINRIPKLYKI